MGTPYGEVYESFLNRVNDNSFVQEMSKTLVTEDLYGLMRIAINNFKFPISDLENRDDELEKFNDNLVEQEIDILARYMKAELAQRCMTDWRLVYPQYQTKDFGFAGTPAYHLAKLADYAKMAMKDADKRSGMLHRAFRHRPYDYTKLSGSD